MRPAAFGLIIAAVAVAGVAGVTVFMTRQGAGDAALAAACGLRPLPRDATLVLYSLGGGDLVSSATIGGQDDTTESTTIEIEAGTTPLYVAAASEKPMIWRVTGARERVIQLALIAPAGTDGAVLAGVVGVAPERVAVGPFSACFEPFRGARSPEAGEARSKLWTMLGRRPDLVTARDSAASIRLPSGEVTVADYSTRDRKTPAGFEARSWADAARFHPAGVAMIDPADVAPPGRAQAYEVLPGQVGVSRLVFEGRLQKVANGPLTYRIVKPIPRFPSGLGGASHVRWVVARGVGMPAGDPGFFSVIREVGDPRDPVDPRLLRP